jgi:hypothetical protein
MVFCGGEENAAGCIGKPDRNIHVVLVDLHKRAFDVVAAARSRFYCIAVDGDAGAVELDRATVG